MDDDDAELLDLVGATNDRKSKKQTPTSKQKPSKKRRPSFSDSEDSFIDDRFSSDHSDDDINVDHSDHSDDDDEDEVPSDVDSDNSLLNEHVDEKMLDGMTELEREAFLNERAERRQLLLEKMEVRRRLAKTRKSARGLSDEKAKKKKKLEDLKAKRSRKTKKEFEEGEYPEGSKHYEDDDKDWAEKLQAVRSRSGKDTASESVPLSVQHLNTVRLSRDILDSWLYAPFFENAVVGKFVRLSIGQDQDRRPVYRICQVVGIGEYKKPYKVVNNLTKKSLRLKYGKAEKPFLMDILSNGEFTESEFKRWKSIMEHEKQRIPSVKEIKNHRKMIEDAIKHVFTNEEIELMIAEKKSVAGVAKNLSIEKAQLLTKKEHAEQTGNLALAQELADEIRQLDAVIEEQSESVESNLLSQLSARNRKTNIEESAKAEQLAREKLKSQGGRVPLDPFARIKSRPGQIFETPGPGQEGAPKPAPIQTTTKAVEELKRPIVSPLPSPLELKPVGISPVDSAPSSAHPDANGAPARNDNHSAEEADPSSSKRVQDPAAFDTQLADIDVDFDI